MLFELAGSAAKEIVIYKTPNGKEPFIEWVNRLDTKYKKRINNRIFRLAYGEYGDFKLLTDGIRELRFHFGAGYRVYFGQKNQKIVILLLGGSKDTQGKDIERAKLYWQEYKEKTHD